MRGTGQMQEGPGACTHLFPAKTPVFRLTRSQAAVARN